MSVWAHKIIQLHSIQHHYTTSRHTSKIKDIMGYLFLDLWTAKELSDCYQTNQAAKAEGISYEDMRLREKAQGLTK